VGWGFAGGAVRAREEGRCGALGEAARGEDVRQPRYSLWIEGRPLSSAARKFKGYVARIQAEARRQVQGREPLKSKRIDIEIIFVTRQPGDVDNKAKRILDALKGIVYHDDDQVRSVKSVGLSAQGFVARGSPEVFKRLLHGNEFLVNVYVGGEVDVHLVDAANIGDGVLVSSRSASVGMSGTATAGTIQIERVVTVEDEEDAQA
jgi:Holliday junction resolvase RusA-like endonuclease